MKIKSDLKIHAKELQKMRRLDLTVQQKCTIFLFMIAAIHIGGLIWIVISEDL